MKRVTDPEVLAQLNSGSTSGGRKPVTDPTLLQELNRESTAMDTVRDVGNQAVRRFNQGLTNLAIAPWRGIDWVGEKITGADFLPNAEDMPLYKQFLDVPKADTTAGRYIGAIAEAAGGSVLPMAGLMQQAARLPMTAPLVPSLTDRFLRPIAQNPGASTAIDLAAATGAGTAQQAAEDLGAGPGGQGLAAIAGGFMAPVAGIGAVRGASRAGRAAFEALPKIRASADGATPIPPEREQAYRMISDWVTRSGGNMNDIAGTWNALQEAQRRFHNAGRVINAQTLAEIYPPLQRLLRAAASGFTEAGEDATRFLSARQTGVLPRGANAQDLARRGIPTRERFLPEMTGAESKRTLGTSFGVPEGNLVPAGQLSRIVDFTKRLFQIKDFQHHGHASNASRTSNEILDALRAQSDPAYRAAFAAGDMVPLRPTVARVLQAWEAQAAQSPTAIRRILERGINQFRARDKQFINRLRDFDSAKQALDDLIADHLGKNSGRLLQQMKRELLEAVDSIQAGNVGPLYTQARGIYSRGARDREILEDFSTAFKDDPDDVLRRYDALTTDNERKLAELGITWGIERQNVGRRAAQDATLAFDTNNTMRVLAAIGSRQRASSGDAADVMRAFGRLVEGEQEMIRGTAKTVLGGSMTDRNLQDALSMGVLEIAQNVQSWSNIWRGSQSAFDMGQRLMTLIIDRSFGFSADRAREMSRILLTANPQEITAHIARLKMMQPPSRMARFNELLERTRERLTATGVGTSAAIAPAITQRPEPE